ncbi:hypothetical protein SAMN02745122_0011 [Acholeplasma oculi]|uniref:hypothetical protein n=1 Tax=Acholeplasma oculi TaxID=35623 RepID=UPI0009A73E74|nr:hypothetical protein [Acholeplasma oculi]SKC34611.1 hypothetical protein SAMN02745122_0011 [Acholeplasma oculi]
MLKKIFIIMSLIVSAFALTINSSYALDTWELNDDGYHYYTQNLQFGNSITIAVDPSEVLEIFDYNLNIYVVPKSTSGIAQNQVKITFDYDDVPGYFGLYYEYADKSYLAISFVSNQAVEIKVRKLSDITNIPDDDLLDVSELPQTKNEGNFLMDVGHVNFSVQDRKVLITITYFGTHKIVYDMGIQTDMSLFNSTEAYYVNLSGDDPQIFINNSDNYYLKDMLSSDSKTFVKHTIWNLKTNELTHVNEYKAYTYIKQNDEGVLIAYFYTDTFVMDRILTAELEYTSRIRTDKFGFITEYTDWNRRQFNYTSDDALSYLNLSVDWNLLVPGWGLHSLGINPLTAVTIPRIDVVNFSNMTNYNITQNEVKTYFESLYDSFENNIQEDSYKLFAFALSDGALIDTGIVKMQTEIYNNKNNPEDPHNFQIFHIVYETNGHIYQTVGEDIDVVVDTDPDISTPDNIFSALEQLLKMFTDFQQFMSSLNWNDTLTIVIAVVVGLIILIIIKSLETVISVIKMIFGAIKLVFMGILNLVKFIFSIPGKLFKFLKFLFIPKKKNKYKRSYRK